MNKIVKTAIAILAAAIVSGAASGIGAGRVRSTAAKASATERAAAVVAAEVVRDGEYCSKDEVSAYIRKFGGALPKNYITKAQARALGWSGGPLEPFAPGKSIGGDRFDNYERRIPAGRYKECDIDTRGRPRGAKRLVFTVDGERIYYTADHYTTFEEIKGKAK